MKTPPYAVVNCWQNAPRFERHGGFQFLTGSIAYGLRMVHEWMCGIKPMTEGLAIDPCIPSAFTRVKTNFPYLGGRIDLTIENPRGRQCGVTSMSVNGREIAARISDPFSQREMPIAPDDLFSSDASEITVTL